MPSLPDRRSHEQPEVVAARADSPPPSLDAEVRDIADTLIGSRQNVSPKRLVAPGPSSPEIQRLLGAAAAAPDHGLLMPWRFVIVPMDKRVLLAEAFALALTDRDSAATPDQIASAKEKAHRAPFLMLAIARLGDVLPDIPAMERLVSLGCAIQNILLSAHAMGYGAGLTSGQAMCSPRIRELFTLATDEHAICCINVGTVVKQKPRRARFSPEDFTSTL